MQKKYIVRLSDQERIVGPTSTVPKSARGETKF
ncbi:hypothetical protein Q31b_29240 [Novipirellula aureliae]|uniref:Uncharacterized protein n=1 Tax=Novipirellula aureliae TaxID=2527966 RepID=A0A5C6DYE8_9BACT|nr:hypothetical protein Q31b_29240 [Novipirellula aureliae]